VDMRIGGDMTNIILMTDLDPQGPRAITLIEVVSGITTDLVTGMRENP